jgi:hypothetical protein
VVGQSVYIGADYSGRFGNYFVHYILIDDVVSAFQSDMPVNMWRSPDWVTVANLSTELPTLIALPRSNELSSKSAFRYFLSEPPDDAMIDSFLSAVEDALRRGRRLIIAAPAEIVIQWISLAMYCFPQHAALDITFNTYVSDPRSSDTLITGINSTAALSQFELMQQFNLFDLLGGPSSAIVTTYYASFMRHALADGGMAKCLSITSFANRLDPCFDVCHLTAVIASYNLLYHDLDTPAEHSCLLKWIIKTLPQWLVSELDTVLCKLVSSWSIAETNLLVELLALAGQSRCDPAIHAVIQRRFLNQALVQPKTTSHLLLKALVLDIKRRPSSIDDVDIARYFDQLRTERDASKIIPFLDLVVALQLSSDYMRSCRDFGQTFLASLLPQAGLECWLVENAREECVNSFLCGIADYVKSNVAARRLGTALRDFISSGRLLRATQEEMFKSYVVCLLRNEARASEDDFLRAGSI